MHTYLLHIEGMMCGMCESHINSVLRKGIVGAKVSSSARKHLITITCEPAISEQQFHDLIDPTGYSLVSMEESAPAGGISRFWKKKK